MPSDPASRLERRLGVTDAVVVGLGAMLGTGVFVVFAPAAARAGSWLLAGLVVAAFVAYANATSTAQLAAVHPESGGAYAYGRCRLGASWGALAGYAFVVGKVASSGAAALAVGAYALPGERRLVAVAAVLVATGVNLLGVARTVLVTRILVAVLVAVLGAVVVVGLLGTRVPTAEATTDASLTGVLGSAALLFFAFAGFARIATLGEEVKDPARTIPRAVPLALGVVLVIYVLVALALLRTLGTERLADSVTPLADVMSAGGADELTWFVRAGGAIAAGAVLLSLLAGISRTAFAMASGGDMPRALAVVHPRFRVPHRAELVVGAAVLGVVLIGGLVGAVSVSAFTVLVYYTVANLAALRLRRDERRSPRALAAAGLFGCVLLAASLPLDVVVWSVTGLLVLLAARQLYRFSTPLDSR